MSRNVTLPPGELFAQFLLLILFAAVFVNIARGTLRQWLRAKFIGDVQPTAARRGAAPRFPNPRAGAGPGERPT